LGLRFQARISLSAITTARVLRTDVDRRAVQPRKGRNPRVTPFDPPNVHLCLSGAIRYTTYFGLQRMARHIDLYVDEPDAFVAALTSNGP
jgi:hypothetical protein